MTIGSPSEVELEGDLEMAEDSEWVGNLDTVEEVGIEKFRTPPPPVPLNPLLAQLLDAEPVR